MIQRKQTLWLIIAAALLGLTLKFPLYIGTLNNVLETNFPNKENTGHLINTIIMIIGCIAAIFLYHNRKIQKIVSIAVLVYWSLIMYLNYSSNISLFTSGSFTIWSIFYFAVPIFIVLAILGIIKDDKLIKSVNSSRLR